jgi:6-phosphogluconolactonase
VPFGYGFSRQDTLIISEAAGGQAGTSALSSYHVNGSDFEMISPSVGTTQIAACWIAVTQNGKFAYTTNAGSGTVSSYRVGQDGSLDLSNPTAATIGPNSHPSDMAFSIDSGILYTLNNHLNTLGIFQVQSDGGLIHVGDQSILAGAMGLAAR